MIYCLLRLAIKIVCTCGFFVCDSFSFLLLVILTLYVDLCNSICF